MEFSGRNVSFWPAPLRRAVDSIAVMLKQVYMLARGRAASSPSPVVRTLAGRDEAAWRLAIREREIGVFRDWYNFLTSAAHDTSRKPLDSAALWEFSAMPEARRRYGNHPTVPYFC
jgi:hypothetical protein